MLTYLFYQRGSWYTCRIKAEFEVFSGTKVNGLSCKSIVGNVDGVSYLFDVFSICDKYHWKFL